MKKSRVLAALLAAVMIAIPLDGCSKTSGNSSSSKSENVNMDLMWFADGNETAAMQKIINQYTAKNPGVKINIVEVPFADMTKKIQMAVAGGEPPALARTTEGILGNVSDSTVDIGGYVKDKKAFLSQYMNSIQNYFVINGKICGVQTDVTANGMIYNKTAFDKAGVKAPTTPDNIWTWDQFETQIKTVMSKGGVKYGLAIDNPTHRWSTLLYEFGGKFMGDTAPAFDSPETLSCINFTKKLMDEGIMPKSVWLGSEDPNNLFRSGQVAVQLAGNWMLQNYHENIKNFEWGVCYLPTQKNRSSVPGGKQLAAFKGSKCEKEAVSFILYATSKEPNAQYCEESLFISPRVDNAKLTYSFGSEYFSIFSNELNNTVPYASHDWGYPGWTAKVGTPLNDGMDQVMAGKETAKDLIKNITDLEHELYKK